MADIHFAAAKREAKEQALTFTLDGDKEPFEVPLPIPGWLVLELAEMGDAEGAGALVAGAKFIKGCLRESQHKRFSECLVRQRYDYDDIVPIVQWLTEEALGLPTGPLRASPKSQRTNGTNSKSKASKKTASRR